MDEAKRAEELFSQGYVCSQAVLASFAPRFGLNVDIALKIATPFGGGMAHMSETCGAVTGALMVIGLAEGNVRSEDKAAKQKAYDLAREFMDRFRSVNGTICCRELLGLDLSVPEQLQLAREQGLFETKCPGYVRDATRILQDLLELSR